jgi:hypothetical protein
MVNGAPIQFVINVGSIHLITHLFLSVCTAVKSYRSSRRRRARPGSTATRRACHVHDRHRGDCAWHREDPSGGPHPSLTRDFDEVRRCYPDLDLRVQRAGRSHESVIGADRSAACPLLIADSVIAAIARIQRALRATRNLADFEA